MNIPVSWHLRHLFTKSQLKALSYASKASACPSNKEHKKMSGNLFGLQVYKNPISCA